MPDKFAPHVRSKIMRSIKGEDTSPELAVRSYLHRKGLRFRVHRRDLPGTPDIVLPKHRAVVFVHGCFWHCHTEPSCPYAKKPKSNRAYWLPKLERTVARDAEHQVNLKTLGWRVFTIWECEISQENLAMLARVIANRAEDRPE